ncbi:MAG: hypothetical protein WKF67_09215 [Rubrobacteraceae bacterium]
MTNEQRPSLEALDGGRAHEDAADPIRPELARLTVPELPGECREALKTLDGRRQEIAAALWPEHPLFRLVDGALRSGDVDELRTALVAVAGLDALDAGAGVPF